MAGMAPAPWHTAPIVAFDLEGSGAQDRGREAILELAAVPLVNGEPAPDRGFTTLVNPGRPIPRRPWISPGFTDAPIHHFGLSATVDASARPEVSHTGRSGMPPPSATSCAPSPLRCGPTRFPPSAPFAARRRCHPVARPSSLASSSPRS
jgi:hypothetical protein